MWKIAQRDLGSESSARGEWHPNPAARNNRGHGPPEIEQREWSEKGVQLVVKRGRLRIVIRDLAAIRWIHRPWCRAEIDGGVHVVPPEHVGAGESCVTASADLPNLFAADEPVGLPPEPNLCQITKIHPLATAPWADGYSPVSSVLCTVQVTAGITVWSGPNRPAARAWKYLVCDCR